MKKKYIRTFKHFDTQIKIREEAMERLTEKRKNLILNLTENLPFQPYDIVKYENKEFMVISITVTNSYELCVILLDETIPYYSSITVLEKDFNKIIKQ